MGVAAHKDNYQNPQEQFLRKEWADLLRYGHGSLPYSLRILNFPLPASFSLRIFCFLTLSS